MQLANPHPECSVDQVGQYLRAYVGKGTTDQLHECYRTLASLALQHKFDRVFAVIGVPAGFKIAFVPTTDATRNGYRHAEIEAMNRGLRAKLFDDERQAIDWLTQPELH